MVAGTNGHGAYYRATCSLCLRWSIRNAGHCLGIDGIDLSPKLNQTDHTLEVSSEFT